MDLFTGIASRWVPYIIQAYRLLTFNWILFIFQKMPSLGYHMFSNFVLIIFLLGIFFKVFPSSFLGKRKHKYYHKIWFGITLSWFFFLRQDHEFNFKVPGFNIQKIFIVHFCVRVCACVCVFFLFFFVLFICKRKTRCKHTSI